MVHGNVIIVNIAGSIHSCVFLVWNKSEPQFRYQFIKSMCIFFYEILHGISAGLPNSVRLISYNILNNLQNHSVFQTKFGSCCLGTRCLTTKMCEKRSAFANNLNYYMRSVLNKNETINWVNCVSKSK